MTNNEQVFPRARKDDLVTRDLPDEVLVYDLKTHKAHCLNHTAALVWKYCDGKNSVTSIAELMALEAGTAVDEEAVWLALERLGKASLLEERVVSSAGSSRVSRRETMRRLGLGFAVSVPVVMSIIAPAAAAAASGCTAPSTAPTGCRNGAPNIGSTPRCTPGCGSITGTCYYDAPGGPTTGTNCSAPVALTAPTTCAGCDPSPLGTAVSWKVG